MKIKDIFKYLFKPRIKQITIRIGNSTFVVESTYGEVIKHYVSYRGTNVEVEIE